MLLEALSTKKGRAIIAGLYFTFASSVVSLSYSVAQAEELEAQEKDIMTTQTNNSGNGGMTWQDMLLSSIGIPAISPGGVTQSVTYQQMNMGTEDSNIDVKFMCYSSAKQPNVNESFTVMCYPVSKKAPKGAKVTVTPSMGMKEFTYDAGGKQSYTFPFIVSAKIPSGVDDNGNTTYETIRRPASVAVGMNVYEGTTTISNGNNTDALVDGYSIDDFVTPINNPTDSTDINNGGNGGGNQEDNGWPDDTNINNGGNGGSGGSNPSSGGNSGNNGWPDGTDINNGGSGGTVDPTDVCVADPNSEACLAKSCDQMGWNSSTCKSSICSLYPDQYSEFCNTPTTEDICKQYPNASGCDVINNSCSDPNSTACADTVSDVCSANPNLEICLPATDGSTIDDGTNDYDDEWKGMVDDLLNDGDDSYDASGYDWANSDGETSGLSDLDDYFNMGDGSEGSESGDELDGLTDDLLGIEGEEEGYFGDNPEFFGDAVEDMYGPEGEGYGDNTVVYGEEYGESYDGSGYGGDGGYQGNSYTGNSGGDSFWDEVTEDPLDAIGKLFQDSVGNLDGSGSGLLDDIKATASGSLLDRLKGLTDTSLLSNPKGSQSDQELFEQAKKLLLSQGYDLDAIKKGKMYDPNSAYTEPNYGWDMNRITTLLKTHKIKVDTASGTNAGKTTNAGAGTGSQEANGKKSLTSPSDANNKNTKTKATSGTANTSLGQNVTAK